MNVCMQTAEAAEDAELQVLLTDPVLQHPQTSAFNTQGNTPSAVNGFQQSYSVMASNLTGPASFTQQTDEVTPSSGRPYGPLTATALDVIAASSGPGAARLLPTGDGQDAATVVARRARGTWGALGQPFTAAGRATGIQETAAELMSNKILPTAVDSAEPRTATDNTTAATARVNRSMGTWGAPQEPVVAAGVKMSQQ